MIIIFFTFPVFLCELILVLMGGVAIYMGAILLAVSAFILVVKILTDPSLGRKTGMLMLAIYILAAVLDCIPPISMMLWQSGGGTLWSGLCALTLSLAAALLMRGWYAGAARDKVKPLPFVGYMISLFSGLFGAFLFYLMCDIGIFGMDFINSFFPVYAACLIAFPVGMLLQLSGQPAGDGDAAAKAEMPWVILLAVGAVVHTLVDLNRIMMMVWERRFFSFPFMGYIPLVLAIVCLVRLSQLDPALWQSLLKRPEKKNT